MRVSETIGGLPILSRVFDHGPLFAALAIFVMLFCITYPLICLRWGKFLKPQRLYVNFTINDGILYPIYMATAAYVLAGNPTIGDICKSPAWHWGVLCAGILLSPALCWWEVRKGKYTIETLWSAWKIYHTLVFPIAFYWIVSTYFMVLLQWRLWSSAIVIAGTIIFIYTHLVDGWAPGVQRAKRFYEKRFGA